MSTTETSPFSMAKPLKLDYKRYGPSPVVGAKFREASNFIDNYRAYQWTLGYDAVVADTSQRSSYTLRCADEDMYDCPFSVTATRFRVETGPAAGQNGYYVVEEGFVPDHNHDAPYEPVDLGVENARRVQLPSNDPTLAHPPTLVRKTPVADMLLDEFLFKIDPAMATEQTLSLLDQNQLPRRTPATDLLALSPSDVVTIFADVPGLSTMYGYRVMAGVERALERQKANPNSRIDPSHDAVHKRCVSIVEQALANLDVKPSAFA
ncbi:hypothetical protein ACM66B_006560 [Microbotryomycetes sp. NB124-2]